MSFLTAALNLANEGFHVFPLEAGSKLPAIKNFPELATRDPDTIRRMWTDPVMGFEQPFNIGISTSHGLLVVDVDNGGDKKGSEEVLKLELAGKEFPATLTQRTPSGGLHYIYKVKTPVKQGANVLAPGIDIRSKGGYIVGCDSVVGGKKYLFGTHTFKISPAPQWVIDECGNVRETPIEQAVSVEQTQALLDRAKFYLLEEAPLAVEGKGGDYTTFKVCARLHDMGLDRPNALGALLEHWNERCSPPWDAEELQRKIENAANYARDGAGFDAPEAQFKPIPKSTEKKDPVERLNEEYAFVIVGGGGHILWETKDSKGEDRLEHISIAAFGQKLASQMMAIGDGKYKPVTEIWMRSSDRRSYDGICFAPQKQVPANFYNLWRGFAFEPYPEGGLVHPNARKAVNRFYEHALENICNGDRDSFNWLMGYFAHMVQRPWEKPLVSLVFKGGKGVGKNVLVDTVGRLLGAHYLLTSNRRYLVGNFNGHLENLILFTLDEAYWSGDKQAEGTLKDLITGSKHNIERKGQEPYTVDNCTRVAIIGNEEWIVPASEDERRFAVFHVGDGRKQDRKYFSELSQWMGDGGYRLLLSDLMHHTISDVNAAPMNNALLDQKIESLGPVHSWWYGCITDGAIMGSEFTANQWPEEVEKERLRSAFKNYAKGRNIKSSWMPDDRLFGKALMKCCPGIKMGRKRGKETRFPVYKLPSIDECRSQWDAFIGHQNKWEKTYD